MTDTDTVLTRIAETAASRICGMFGTMDHYRDDIAAQVAQSISERLSELIDTAKKESDVDRG